MPEACRAPEPAVPRNRTTNNTPGSTQSYPCRNHVRVHLPDKPSHHQPVQAGAAFPESGRARYNFPVMTDATTGGQVDAGTAASDASNEWLDLLDQVLLGLDHALNNRLGAL